MTLEEQVRPLNQVMLFQILAAPAAGPMLDFVGYGEERGLNGHGEVIDC